MFNNSHQYEMSTFFFFFFFVPTMLDYNVYKIHTSPMEKQQPCQNLSLDVGNEVHQMSSSVYFTQVTIYIYIYILCAVATPRNIFRVFLNNYKLHNLIKRKFYILTTTTIKKIRKYIEFTIAFYEFSYFESVI